MAIQHRTSSLASALAWLGGGVAVGVAAGLAFIAFGADHFFPQARGGDPVADCRTHLSELTNDIWAGYNQGRRADSLDDLRTRSTDAATFLCPAAGPEHGTTPNGLATDYVYAPGMGEGDAMLHPLLFELPSNHGQSFCHVMPRNLGDPTELRDVSHIHGVVQQLNNYLAPLRTRGRAAEIQKPEGR